MVLGGDIPGRYAVLPEESGNRLFGFSPLRTGMADNE